MVIRLIHLDIGADTIRTVVAGFRRIGDAVQPCDARLSMSGTFNDADALVLYVRSESDAISCAKASKSYPYDKSARLAGIQDHLRGAETGGVGCFASFCNTDSGR